jgi:hypothetical protein
MRYFDAGMVLYAVSIEGGLSSSFVELTRLLGL